MGLSSPPSPVLWVTTTATRLSVQRSLLAPLSLPPPPLSSQRDGPEVPLPRSAFSLWWYAVNRLRWRHVALSSSRVSPLRTCPALRPRGCSAYSPYRAPNCCLLSNEKHRLSLLYAPRLCVRTPTTSFSRLYHAASALVPSGSVQAIAALHAEFPTTLRARLWVGGLCTHWLTSMNFQEASFPIITGFLTRSSLDDVRQHMASRKMADRRKSEKTKKRISESAVSESANHLRFPVGTFARRHVRTFAPSYVHMSW